MALKAGGKNVKYVDVAVVGNGPSAISLSFMLSGWTPYYSPPVDAAPDDVLHARLETAAATPITDMDLEYLSSGLEGRSSSPLGLLFDQLAHPAADLGSDEPSRLRWALHREHSVSHVVLGTGPPGGSWHAMNADMRTLSRCDWIELPNLPFRRWYAERRSKCGSQPAAAASDEVPYRATAGDVGRYYSDYVCEHGLEGNFVSGYRVDSVQRIGGRSGCCLDCGCGGGGGAQTLAGSSRCAPTSQQLLQRRPASHRWRVSATCLATGAELLVAARFVVLATGSCGRPSRLDAPGEADAPYVQHSAADLQAWTAAAAAADRGGKPLLVVGSGVSAAEAVLAALGAGRSVVHVYRRSATDRGIVFGSLPPSLYPEYRALGALMRGELADGAYASHAQSRVAEFGRDGSVAIERLSDGRRTTVDVGLALVLIGAAPDLAFMPGAGRGLGRDDSRPVDGRDNPLAVDPFTYQCVREPSLFAMGPLVGDSFVRFLQGAALGIAKRLREEATAAATERGSAPIRRPTAPPLDRHYLSRVAVTAE